MKSKNNNIKIIASAIPFAAALAFASTTDVMAAETATTTPILQVQDSKGTNIEFVAEYMNNEAYRTKARQALKDSLVANRPVLVAEDGEWIKVDNISEGMSFISNEIAKEVGLSESDMAKVEASATTFEKSEALSNVDSYKVSDSGKVVDSKGKEVTDGSKISSGGGGGGGSTVITDDNDADDYGDDLYNS